MTPHPAKLLVVIPITAAVAAAVGLGIHPYAALIAAITGSVSAALAGVPAVSWAVGHGRTRLLDLAVIGAVAGAVPVVLFWGIAMIWGALLADPSMRGRPIGPRLDAAPLFFGVPVLIGTLTGVIYWLTVLNRELPRWVAFGLSLGLLGVTAWSFGWGR